MLHGEILAVRSVRIGNSLFRNQHTSRVHRRETVVILTFNFHCPRQRIPAVCSQVSDVKMAFASRARDLEPRHRSRRMYTTKVGFGANMLTNIPSFRHEQDLNPGGSRMEIYETISHVSTNQVWLHINSASSRVYFRPIAHFSFVGSAGAGQLARSYLCLESLSTPTRLLPPPPPRPRLIHKRSRLSLLHDIHLFSFLIRLTPGLHPVADLLSYSSLLRSYT